MGDVVPDLTVILDVPAEVGLERIKHRVSDMPDRMEQENVEFYGKVREGYLHLANSLPERFFVVDGMGEPDDIEIMIWNEIHPGFSQKIKENPSEFCRSRAFHHLPNASIRIDCTMDYFFGEIIFYF